MKARVWLALAAGVLATGAVTAADTKEPTKAEKAAVKVVADLPYAGEKGDDKQKLDLYLPEGAKGAPVLVFFHGGGYSKGDRKDVAKFGEALAGQGLAVAAVGYRLIGEQVKYPAPVEDGAKAVAWVKENAGKHGLSADRLFVGGHSAGGHLAALLATDDEYLKAEKKSLADVRGVFGVSGVYMIDAKEKVFHPAFTDDEKVCKAASPLEHVAADRPPMLLVYGDKDLPGLPAGAEVFAKALTKAKCEATATECKKRDHITIMLDLKDADDPLFKDAKEFILKVTTAAPK